MKKKRIVILLGAGATVPWGGKTSDKLTKTVLDPEENETNILSNTEKIPLGKFLQRKIEEFYKLNEESHSNEADDAKEVINFEHVLEIIEYLFSYYRNKNFSNHIWARPSFPSVFKVENEIDNEIPEEEIEIWDIENDKNQKKSVTLYKLYQEILWRLCEQIRDYSESFGKTDYEKKDHKFCEFINTLSERNILRVYSLNYDNLILQQKGIQDSFFNGFESENKYRYNYSRIIQNADENCFYNLHGSFYFKDDHINHYAASEIVFEPNTPTVIRPEHNVELLGTPIIRSQIITGSQKLLKTLVQPISAFNYIFRNDCYNANEIMVIGYSFTDVHINNILASALDSNTNNKFNIITLIDNPNSFRDFQNQLIRSFKNHEKEINTIIFMEEQDWLYSENNTFSIYTKGFLS